MIAGNPSTEPLRRVVYWQTGCSAGSTTVHAVGNPSTEPQRAAPVGLQYSAQPRSAPALFTLEHASARLAAGGSRVGAHAPNIITVAHRAAIRLM